MAEMVINHLDGERGLTAKIQDALCEARKQFIYIGFLLEEADRLEYYRDGGFSDIYEYCAHAFGFERSSTNNFIRVYRCFGSGMGLQSGYEDYGYSQLTEMCSMNETQLRQCKPGMTVKALREIKKGVSVQTSGRTVACDPAPAPVQTSGQTCDEWGMSASSSHYLALELYLKNRFSGKCRFTFVDFMSSVMSSGGEFAVDIPGKGKYSASVMFHANRILVCFNSISCGISYAAAFYILQRLAGIEAVYVPKR